MKLQSLIIGLLAGMAGVYFAVIGESHLAAMMFILAVLWKIESQMPKK